MAYEIGMGVTQTEHSGKMTGLPSISTSCLCNKLCQARIKNGEAVCSHCYSQRMMGFRKYVATAMERNTKALTERLFPKKDAKNMRLYFTSKMEQQNPKKLARIESFGDVANVTQARNYIRIIKANPKFNFGIWSKNPGIWATAFEKEGKPKNCTFVLSSLRVNVPDQPGPRISPYVDHVFTVYSKDYRDANGIETNCAGVSCAQCGRCYRKNKNDFYVNELLR